MSILFQNAITRTEFTRKRDSLPEDPLDYFLQELLQPNDMLPTYITSHQTKQAKETKLAIY